MRAGSLSDTEVANIINEHFVSAFAKKARGLMAAYIIQNQLTAVADAKSFDAEGYRFDRGLSSENEWVFTRDSV